MDFPLLDLLSPVDLFNRIRYIVTQGGSHPVFERIGITIEIYYLPVFGVPCD
jgi:hypothetical protein